MLLRANLKSVTDHLRTTKSRTLVKLGCQPDTVTLKDGVFAFPINITKQTDLSLATIALSGLLGGEKFGTNAEKPTETMHTMEMQYKPDMTGCPSGMILSMKPVQRDDKSFSVKFIGRDAEKQTSFCWGEVSHMAVDHDVISGNL